MVINNRGKEYCDYIFKKLFKLTIALVSPELYNVFESVHEVSMNVIEEPSESDDTLKCTFMIVLILYFGIQYLLGGTEVVDPITPLDVDFDMLDNLGLMTISTEAKDSLASMSTYYTTSPMIEHYNYIECSEVIPTEGVIPPTNDESVLNTNVVEVDDPIRDAELREAIQYSGVEDTGDIAESILIIEEVSGQQETSLSEDSVIYLPETTSESESEGHVHIIAERFLTYSEWVDSILIGEDHFNEVNT